MSDMVETLAYSGPVPWHGKGNDLGGRVTASDMLVGAEMDWLVEKQDVTVNGRVVEGVKGLVRVPHGNTLKIVSDDYGIVQNRELADLAEAMAGRGVQAWEVGASLDEGKRVFFCGKLADREIAGDLVRDYLTVASSHDQSMSVVAGFDPTRTVCWNTLAVFLANNGQRPRITIRHTKSASEKVKLAAKLCETAREYFDGFHDEAVALVGSAMTVVEAVELSETLFPKYRSEATGEIITPRLQGIVIDLFKGMSCVPADRRIAGTRWGFYQALTAALDHNRKGGGRLSRFLTGADDSIRSRAWKFLTGK